MTITSSVPPVSSAKSLSHASSSEHSGSSMDGGTITTVAILFSSCGMRGEQASEKRKWRHRAYQSTTTTSGSSAICGQFWEAQKNVSKTKKIWLMLPYRVCSATVFVKVSPLSNLYCAQHILRVNWLSILEIEEQRMSFFSVRYQKKMKSIVELKNAFLRKT